MTFTFDASLATDLAKVRFHTGDTHSEGYYLADETINALVTSEGSVGGAVVACLKYIITQLSTPNFRLDWLTVSNEQARDGYEKLLKSKALEFGISLSKVTASSTISLPYRADSYQYTSTTRTVTEDDNDTMHDGTP
ncbi:MAG TPA: hypothetical protein VIY48_15990 [Candidatus Paceibacterota bacterium]